MTNKYIKSLNQFKKNENVFQCPICNSSIKLNESNSFLCNNNHCFDISKKGYINLLYNNIKTNYNKSLFLSRKEIFQKGFYEPVSSVIKNIVQTHLLGKNSCNIIDVGCGEGYYTNQLICDKELSKHNFFGVDLSKEAISLATQYSTEVNWCVGNLANIPFKNNTMDILLDILTPANYNEFNRILKEDGLIIKVIPGRLYLQEIRELISSKLINKTYKNNNVVNYLEKHINIIDKKVVNYKCDLTKEDCKNFLNMTPMLFSINLDEIQECNIETITINLEIIIGNKKGIDTNLDDFSDIIIDENSITKSLIGCISLGEISLDTIKEERLSTQLLD